MGTEVLRPQDFLIHHRINVSPVVFPRRKTNFNGNRKQRRRSPEPLVVPKRSVSVNDLKTTRSSSNQVGFGQVTILKRGESIDLKENNSDEFADVYAGSAFSLSPSPRAVPLPSFFSRKLSPTTTVDDSATKDLRRILRLDGNNFTRRGGSKSTHSG